MRRLHLTTLLCAAFAIVALAVPGVGSAAARGPRLTAAPSPVGFGQPLTIRGRGWPVIEFCARRVALSLQSGQNAFAIGSVRIGDGGGFAAVGRRAEPEWAPASGASSRG